MKSKLNIFLLALISVIITGTACSRKLSVQSGLITNSSKTGFGIKSGDSVSIRDVNKKVLRSFYNTYGEMRGTSWFRSANGFGVNFKNYGMSNTIYYKENGVVETEIHSYSGDKLPQRVQQFVRSRFYDFTINHVTEIHKNEATAFYVQIEDASSIKTLKIVEDEFEIVETLIKR